MMVHKPCHYISSFSGAMAAGICDRGDISPQLELSTMNHSQNEMR